MRDYKSIYASGLPHRAITVYMYLCGRANPKGECWPAIGTIAKELHLSRSTVKRALHDLEQNSFIRREMRYRENGSTSSYLFCFQ